MVFNKKSKKQTETIEEENIGKDELFTKSKEISDIQEKINTIIDKHKDETVSKEKYRDYYNAMESFKKSLYKFYEELNVTKYKRALLRGEPEDSARTRALINKDNITAESDARLFLKDSYNVKNIISSEVSEYSNGYIVTIKWNPYGDNIPTQTAKVYVNKDGRCSFDKW
jgi:hypothetical protein